jgi:Fe-S cluster biogenesis protein NfuA
VQPFVEQVVTRSLAWLGARHGRGAPVPATYAEGAVVPSVLPVPEVPPPAPPPGLAAVLADDDEPPPATPVESLWDFGGGLTRDAVERVLDELVRPALNADGGDIFLHHIDEDNNIHVKLVGSCSTCPSSVATMKMGVERLLQEEFPEMGDLVQVD